MIDLEEYRAYCLAKPGTEETMPFDDQTLVFKVMGKMYALTGLEKRPLSVNLKCDPERATELRAQYPAITPGYHMNKKHWNTVLCDGSIPKALLLELTDHSYDLVVKGLKKEEKEILKILAEQLKGG